MKANNLTISMPGGCNKNCPYCISNMTYPVKEQRIRFLSNLEKAAQLARRIGISHILITGKGEPTLQAHALDRIFEVFHDFPIEIQTNGKTFFNSHTFKIMKRNVDVVAISIDDPLDFNMFDFSDSVDPIPFIVRYTIVYNKLFKNYSLTDLVSECNRRGVSQLTIRNMTIPDRVIDTPVSMNTVEWIAHNSHREGYNQIRSQLATLIKDEQAKFIRKLPFGPSLYDIHGVGYTHMNYCVESENGEDIRSLIYQADGHLYSTWDSRGSIIF